MESYHKKKIGSIPKDSTGGSSIRKGMVVFNGGTSETGLVGDVTGNCVSVEQQAGQLFHPAPCQAKDISSDDLSKHQRYQDRQDDIDDILFNVVQKFLHSDQKSFLL